MFQLQEKEKNKLLKTLYSEQYINDIYKEYHLTYRNTNNRFKNMFNIFIDDIHEVVNKYHIINRNINIVVDKNNSLKTEFNNLLEDYNKGIEIIKENKNHTCKCNCKPINELRYEDLKDNIEFKSSLNVNKGLVNTCKELKKDNKEQMNIINELNESLKNTKNSIVENDEVIKKDIIEDDKTDNNIFDINKEVIKCDYCSKCPYPVNMLDKLVINGKKYNVCDENKSMLYNKLMENDNNENNETIDENTDNIDCNKKLNKMNLEQINKLIKELHEKPHKTWEEQQLLTKACTKRNRKKNEPTDDEKELQKVKNKLNIYFSKKYENHKYILNKNIITLYGDVYNINDKINEDDIKNELNIKDKNLSRFIKLSLFFNKIINNNLIYNSIFYIPVYTVEKLKEKYFDEIIIYIENIIKSKK